MPQRSNRRRFLGQVAALSTAALVSSGRQAQAIDPISRSGKSKFKFSLAAYSYRALLSGKDAKLTLFDFIDDCAAMQLEGTELTSYYFPDEVTDDYLRSLKQHCFRLGLDISGTAVRNDFAQILEVDRQRDIDHVKRWVDYAAILDAPVIRVFAGKVGRDTSPEQAHRWIVAGLEECCEYAGQHGVHLALENHGGPTATAEGLLALVRDVDSPWFGVNLDSGNFHTEDIYGDLEKVAPYALNVQIKVVMSGPDNVKQPADFKRLSQMLNASGYRGYVVLEYEESEDPRQVCPSYVEQLRAAFA